MSMFPDLSGSNYNVLQLAEFGAWAKVIVRSNSGNILNRTVLQAVKELNDYIQNIEAFKSDGTVLKVKVLIKTCVFCTSNKNTKSLHCNCQI